MNQFDLTSMTPQDSPAVVPVDPITDGPIDRVDELISRYFDEELSEDQVAELESLILQDEQNLNRYIDHARLHADLCALFNPQVGRTSATFLESLVEGELRRGD